MKKTDTLQIAYDDAIENANRCRQAALRLYAEDKNNRIIAAHHAACWFRSLAAATAIRVYRDRKESAPKGINQFPRTAEMIIATCAPDHEGAGKAFWDDFNARCGLMEISFTVNGFPFDFAEFAVELENQYDQATEQAAKELLKTRALDIQEKLRRVEAFIDAEFETLYREP